MSSSDRLWQRFILRQPSPLSSLLLQIALGGAGFGIAAFLFNFLHVYSGVTTLVTVVLIVLSGEMLPALLLTFVLLILCDYFFIAPTGSIFDVPASFEHFLILSLSSIVVSILTASLRASYRESLRAKEEAELARNTMEKMLALVSHDVRNPLASIKTSAQLILRQPHQQERIGSLAKIMINSLDRIDTMIQSLLDVSSMRAGRMVPLQFTSCDLQSIVSETVEGLRIAFGNRFLYSGSEALLGSWSQGGIRRAVENLAANAVKYGSAETPITITVRRVDERAQISVHNEGGAIPTEEQANLFDSFWRGTTSGQKRGWGLGLALVKGIAEAHGGCVLLKSEPGKGTTFTLDLPFMPVTARGASPDLREKASS